MSLDPSVFQIALPAIAALIGGSALLLAKRAGRRLDDSLSDDSVKPPINTGKRPAKKFLSVPGGGTTVVTEDLTIDLASPLVIRSEIGIGKSHVFAVGKSGPAPVKGPRGRYRTAGRSSKTGAPAKG
jgi:hypothetical protein